jgi:hypothetical protein
MIVLAVMTAALYLILVSGGVALYLWARDVTTENARTAQQGDQAHDAICDLRADLERRVETSREFLRENPQGIPGISRRVILTGIANQEETIDALADLDCTPAP